MTATLRCCLADASGYDEEASGPLQLAYAEAAAAGRLGVSEVCPSSL